VYARLCDVTGDVRAAVAHGRAAAEVAEKTGNQAIRVFAFSALGLANVLDEQWREALDALGQALAIAREAAPAFRGKRSCWHTWLARSSGWVTPRRHG